MELATTHLANSMQGHETVTLAYLSTRFSLSLPEAHQTMQSFIDSHPGTVVKHCVSGWIGPQMVFRITDKPDDVTATMSKVHDTRLYSVGPGLAKDMWSKSALCLKHPIVAEKVKILSEAEANAQDKKGAAATGTSAASKVTKSLSLASSNKAPKTPVAQTKPKPSQNGKSTTKATPTTVDSNGKHALDEDSEDEEFQVTRRTKKSRKLLKEASKAKVLNDSDDEDENGLVENKGDSNGSKKRKREALETPVPAPSWAKANEEEGKIKKLVAVHGSHDLDAKAWLLFFQGSASDAAKSKRPSATSTTMAGM